MLLIAGAFAIILLVGRSRDDIQVMILFPSNVLEFGRVKRSYLNCTKVMRFFSPPDSSSSRFLRGMLNMLEQKEPSYFFLNLCEVLTVGRQSRLRMYRMYKGLQQTQTRITVHSYDMKNDMGNSCLWNTAKEMQTKDEPLSTCLQSCRTYARPHFCGRKIRPKI